MTDDGLIRIEIVSPSRVLAARVILGVSALAYVAIGLAFIFVPERIIGYVGIEAAPGSALTDIRAVYGGLDFGIGAFLLHCLLGGKLRMGLVAATLTLGGLACARILGIIVDGQQDAVTYYLLASEIIGGALCLVGLGLVRHLPSEN